MNVLNHQSPSICGADEKVGGTHRRYETFSRQHREQLAVGHGQTENLGSKSRTKARITVVVRKRPLTQSEGLSNEVDIVSVLDNNTTIRIGEPRKNVFGSPYIEPHNFIFDRAYSDTHSNVEVYNSCVRKLVDAVFQQGARCSCFAYGQTGSGKTYTMVGSGRPGCKTKTAAKLGLVELAGKDMFKWMSRPEFDFHTSLYISFFEIYCNRIYDLLNQRNLVKALETKTTDGVVLKNLMCIRCTDIDVMLQQISIGLDQRVVASNSKNLDSSRGHAILTLDVRNEHTNQTIGKLAFIDLAGSERGADAMHAGKLTQMDGAGINRSLLALKECIRALDRQSTHVPFRDSELTKVLREMFIGNKTKTLMISCVSPSSTCCEQTLNTLRYADRVKAIRRYCKPDLEDIDSSNEEAEVSARSTLTTLSMPERDEGNSSNMSGDESRHTDRSLRVVNPQKTNHKKDIPEMERARRDLTNYESTKLATHSCSGSIALSPRPLQDTNRKEIHVDLQNQSRKGSNSKKIALSKKSQLDKSRMKNYDSLRSDHDRLLEISDSMTQGDNLSGRKFGLTSIGSELNANKGKPSKKGIHRATMEKPYVKQKFGLQNPQRSTLLMSNSETFKKECSLSASCFPGHTSSSTFQSEDEGIVMSKQAAKKAPTKIHVSQGGKLNNTEYTDIQDQSEKIESQSGYTNSCDFTVDIENTNSRSKTSSAAMMSLEYEPPMSLRRLFAMTTNGCIQSKSAMDKIFPRKENNELIAAASILRKRYKELNFPLIPHTTESSSPLSLDTAIKMVKGLSQLRSQDVFKFYTRYTAKFEVLYHELIRFHRECIEGQTGLNLMQHQMLQHIENSKRFQLNAKYLTSLRQVIDCEIAMYSRLGKRLAEIERMQALQSQIFSSYQQAKTDESTPLNTEPENMQCRTRNSIVDTNEKLLEPSRFPKMTSLCPGMNKLDNSTPRTMRSHLSDGDQSDRLSVRSKSSVSQKLRVLKKSNLPDVVKHRSHSEKEKQAYS